jgi:hypothetical protein
MRAHDMADAIGQSISSYFEAAESDTDYYDEYYSQFIASEWVVTDRINAQTGQDFGSWSEYFGPRRLNDDTFTLTQQYNLTDEDFTGYNLGIDWVSAIFNPSAAETDDPWRAEDIIIVCRTISSANEWR